MKKKWTVAVLFAVMMIILSTAVSGDIKENWVALSSSSGKWITQKEYTYNYNTSAYTFYCYKVVVPATGHLRINIQGDSNLEICIKKTRGGDSDIYLSNGRRYGVDKGIYYIYAGKYSGGTKFKYTYIKAPAETNYIRSKATLLKKNTRKQIAHTWKYNFNRWYKIRLTAKQKVTINVIDRLKAALTDSKGRKIETNRYTNENGYRLVSEKALAVGTYYIFIDDDLEYYQMPCGGDISWK